MIHSSSCVPIGLWAFHLSMHGSDLWYLNVDLTDNQHNTSLLQTPCSIIVIGDCHLVSNGHQGILPLSARKVSISRLWSMQYPGAKSPFASTLESYTWDHVSLSIRSWWKPHVIHCLDQSQLWNRNECCLAVWLDYLIHY
jgi:hypothetical protein